LRQEFGELELLDEITKLHYHLKLNPKVIGLMQTDQIRAYRKVMGAWYVPSYVHSSIQWSVHDPFIENELPNIKWHIITKESMTLKDTKFIPAQGSVKLHTYNNNTRVPTVSMPSHKANKEDMNTKSNITRLQHWDSVANIMNCAYDALLSILYNTWNQDVAFWTAGFERFNGEWLKPLS
ncbi:hypothetical protein ARMGADRAFT_905905, partial [Armillaria gallica]